MGIDFDIFQPLPQGGFTFNVLSACKAENVNLSEACTIQFDSSNEFQSIGNFSRGNLPAEPGIVGWGVWLGTAYTVLLITVSLGFMVGELIARLEFRRVKKHNSRGQKYFVRQFLGFLDPHDDQSKAREALRSLVLGTADTQMVLVIAQTLNFATLGKCGLSAYHFRAAVDAMLISYSSVVLSVALVRSYWRSIPTAAFRVILSLGVYLCIVLIFSTGTSFAADWPPPASRNDSLILLPVACLLESDLFAEVMSQLDEQPNAIRGSIDSLAFPAEIVFLILLGTVFLLAHCATVIRRVNGRHGEGNTVVKIWKNKWHGILAIVYWIYVLFTPAIISIWCWVQIGLTRDWVSKSGWQGNPNPEDNVWDTGQLIPLLSIILLLVSVSNTIWERKIQRGKERPESVAKRTEDGTKLLPYRYEIAHGI